ncbi:MAG: PIN/TRAM domain-containing protein [Coriobacteriia bacterium]|nr:PIN/TRAM domain-containing protein [Coriobacteriia bacterium]
MGVEAMFVQLTRVALVTVGALGGFAVSQQVDWTAQTGFSEGFVIFVFIILGASIGYVLGGIIGREATSAYRRIHQKLAELRTPALLLGSVGFVVGLLMAFLISSSLFRYLERPEWLGFVVTVLLYVFCAYASTSLFLLPSRDETLTWSFGAAAPTDERPPKLLDTSAIIDGRFAELAKSGMLEGPLRVPRFVLVELQTLADSADDARRARGRRGLDLLTTLATGENSVLVMESDFAEIPTVDAKLVKLALSSGGTVVTVDFNLTKVARVEGAAVLNVNEAAEALRPVLLPGDGLHIAITKEGKEAGQGVGYLADGTMVVVAEAASAVGTDIDTEVTSVLQTSAGRMVFARIREVS